MEVSFVTVFTYIMGMKLGRSRSRTYLTFVTTNLHHPLVHHPNNNSWDTINMFNPEISTIPIIIHGTP